MNTPNKRLSLGDLNRGQVFVLTEGSPETIVSFPGTYLILKGGSLDYSKYLTASLYSAGSGSSSGLYVSEDGQVLLDSPTADEIFDIPEMSDIESVTYEPYYDNTTKLQKVRAIIRIRNSSQNKDNVEGVDARIFNPNTFILPANKVSTSETFIAPSPATPSVYFKRDGTAISWGWDNVSGLGSYSNVRYEWIISSSNSASATALVSGSKSYTTSSSYNIGTSSVIKTYRVSSRDSDISATSSGRWLRVKSVVTGTNGTEYSSAYSTPI
jgi:alpha-tubulin suppressor-like RCC1 family protein